MTDWPGIKPFSVQCKQVREKKNLTLEAVQINISNSRNCPSKVRSPHVLASGDWKFQRQTQIAISVVLVHINSSLFGIQVVREKRCSYQQLGKPKKKKQNKRKEKRWLCRQGLRVVSSEKYKRRGEIEASRETQRSWETLAWRVLRVSRMRLYRLRWRTDDHPFSSPEPLVFRLKMSLTSDSGRAKKFEFFHWLKMNAQQK